jgi:hypothetical protein
LLDKKDWTLADLLKFEFTVVNQPSPLQKIEPPKITPLPKLQTQTPAATMVSRVIRALEPVEGVVGLINQGATCYRG